MFCFSSSSSFKVNTQFLLKKNEKIVIQLKIKLIYCIDRHLRNYTPNKLKKKKKKKKTSLIKLSDRL